MKHARSNVPLTVVKPARDLPATPGTSASHGAPVAPAYLGQEERTLWSKLQSEFGMDDGPGLILLEQMCRNLQLARECREKVEKDGKIKKGREHPLLKVWRDAEKQASAALKALNFDL